MIACHELVFVIDQQRFIFSAGVSSRCHRNFMLGLINGLRKLIE
jgi:hypothetical protein